MERKRPSRARTPGSAERYRYVWNGERFRAALEASGWTQEALARALGVSNRTVPNWFGSTEPKGSFVYAIEQLLGLEHGYLYDPIDA